MTKVCIECKEEKYIENFTISNKSMGYRHSRCKPCQCLKQKNWRLKNPDKHKKYRKNYRLKNPIERIRNNIRRRIYQVIKRKYITKNNKINSYLGCSLQELKNHLSDKFVPGMSWDNYGSVWHIDHIKPLSFGKNLKELEELSHYTNLQPLFAIDNIKKSNKYKIKAI